MRQGLILYFASWSSPVCSYKSLVLCRLLKTGAVIRPICVTCGKPLPQQRSKRSDSNVRMQEARYAHEHNVLRQLFRPMGLVSGAIGPHSVAFASGGAVASTHSTGWGEGYARRPCNWK